MEIVDKDFQLQFQFALEMVILSRSKNGATLSEIRDDFENCLGINFEEIMGYRCWEQFIKPMLTNVMVNISTVTLNGGCILYYMNIDAAIEKLEDSDNMSENMAFIVSVLDIDVKKLKEIRNASLSSQPHSSDSSQSSIRNVHPKSTSSLISSIVEDCEFYEHLLIGDNFFLEIARMNLGYRSYSITSDKNMIRYIGHCVSGQSIRKAIVNISRTINEIRCDRAIINLGSIDLLQGRELVDMMRDLVQLNKILYERNIHPIFTTIPALANQMHNPRIQKNRIHFNNFIMNKFDHIDIDICFLSNLNQVSFDLYQPLSRNVSGTRCPIVLWNKCGRQMVVNRLKRKLLQYHEY